MTSELAFIAALRRIATHPGARNLEDDRSGNGEYFFEYIELYVNP